MAAMNTIRRVEGSMGGKGASATLAVIRTHGTEGLKVILDQTIDLIDQAFASPESHFIQAFVSELNILSFYPKKDRRVFQMVINNPYIQEHAFGNLSLIWEELVHQEKREGVEYASW